MKRRNPLLLWAGALALCLTLSACGGSGGIRSADSSYADDAYYDMEEPMAAAEVAESYYGGGAYNMAAARAMYPPEEPEEADDRNAGSPENPQKLIRTADLSMETMEFEETAAALSDLTERMEGYFADVDAGERGGGSRRATYTIRVPEKNFKAFLNQAGELCHETWRHVSQDDVSEIYYDTEGRLRTQKTKLERLRELLEQAENMEDIIAIESAIAETEEQIDAFSGTLRHYDSLVNYSTVTLSLYEVYRFSNVEEVSDSFATRLGNAFVDGTRNFGYWLEDVAEALAYSWLWLLILAAVVFGGVRLYRRRKAQKRRKAENAQENRQ